MSTKLAVIVEDEPHLVDIFGRVLVLVNFQVKKFSTGDAAFEYLSRSRPDLLLLDLNLPGISGIDILRRMETSEQLPETKVVVVTADIENTRLIDSPVDAVLIKPVGVNQLKEVIFQLFPDLAPDTA
jgi:DNA-binding response OmpR family regulator